ncbi:uroporphyrinogen-III C-methyltransferase [Burkholderia multivorans]|uniref:uroporphyrinogen-III C-methyltransferase n=1 Tax=Burkholderia multivorans TaxID=87883 RepID=A0A8E2S2S3_9BURK|nr:uroporphyrinogen-III C-methyltransferase [Burkholderia multivorans]PRE64845.1 uroporphyrinogen-III C-methyltransferase [Burkholderia multivorans]PRE79611.1 uroporphyrinogen-III C-methyltransferase [Burkholderia multivorans]PRF28710.1 uroporphyrinogen-III C-methyltransferase [Burkholderia multivorans]PRG19707.1 uroporphyrinogen-III C-methyltransferase [Burkholderia multivorans]
MSSARYGRFVSLRHVTPFRRPSARGRFVALSRLVTARAVLRTMSRAWLVGAGPGDADLLTLKAVRAIAAADVLLVDDLVNPDVLRHARADAQIEHVGKRGGHASTPQAEIVATMLAHLRAGRSVARLKGGDPFVFGRGGEELIALGAAGFAVEVVSGITAGIAAPAALGIPVTHRGDAQGVIFVTGHGAGADEPDWRALAATRMTIVVYMGMRRLDAIAAALRDGGLPGDTPCAAIANATRDTQRHVLATLDQIVERTGAAGIGSPAIVVIGRVAALAADPAVQAALAGGGRAERA